MQRKYIVIGAEPGSSMMGAHFRAGGAAPFFGFPISELSGEVVELDLIWKREILALREQLHGNCEHRRKVRPAGSLPRRQSAGSKLEPDKTISVALAAWARGRS